MNNKNEVKIQRTQKQYQTVCDLAAEGRWLAAANTADEYGFSVHEFIAFHAHIEEFGAPFKNTIDAYDIAIIFANSPSK